MALENRALYSASLEKLSGISTTLADFLSAPSGGKVSRISKPEAPAPAEPGPALAAAPCASRSGRAVLAGGLKALATVRPPRPSPLPPLPASSSSCRGAALLLDDQASFAAAVASGGLGTFGTCGTPSARGRCPVAISSATFCLLAAPMGSSERRQARISSSLRPCACRTCCCACCACCGSCLAASPPAGRGAATNANAAVAAAGLLRLGGRAQGLPPEKTCARAPWELLALEHRRRRALGWLCFLPSPQRGVIHGRLDGADVLIHPVEVEDEPLETVVHLAVVRVQLRGLPRLEVRPLQLPALLAQEREGFPGAEHDEPVLVDLALLVLVHRVEDLNLLAAMWPPPPCLRPGAGCHSEGAGGVTPECWGDQATLLINEPRKFKSRAVSFEQAGMAWIKAFSLGAVLVEARRRKDVSRLQRRIAVQDAEARARAAAMMNEAPSPSGEGEGSRSQERSIEREMEVEAMRVKHDAEIRDMALKNEIQMAELVRIHSTAVAVMERSMDVLRMENQELKERHSKLAFRWKQQLADVLSAHMDGRLHLDKDVMTMLADLDADIMGTAGPSDAAAGYVTPVPSPARAQSSVVELGGMYSGVEHGPRLALAQPDMVKRLLQVGVEAAAAAKLAAPGTFPSIKTPGRPRALQSLKLDRNVAPAAAEPTAPPTAPPVQHLPAVKPQP
eukprot:CAMPEP_0182868104 /NCGR_PEP_ID=MMETSP0034_2-20130328/9114_1 /TAXON_ID=156128 /ORGANISM="Nephroselmis pyriformis, Strain CCMP717" /LENGTH=677 /DNA_ID=CAMNT_0025000493 /DNA_START=63 /DNA_END=2094 /DNA_ORIENTATION=+